MKNSLTKRIYHAFVCKWYGMQTFRGGWMLAHQYYTDYKQRKASFWKIASVHLKGWSYCDWNIIGVTNENRKGYLCTRDYCSLHPFNGSYSSWIDDKLTLKYILNGTEAGKYMPDYYYELMSDGRIVRLMDLKAEYGATTEGIAKLLRDRGLLAFKLVKASLGVGFYRAEFKDGKYWMNGEEMDLQSFSNKLKGLKSYLITEYLLPHPEIAKLCDKSVGCLRYIVGRNLDGNVVDVYSFMRFGTKRSKFVENYNSGGVLSIINGGKYIGGNILDAQTQKNIKISKHPDTGIDLQGSIPHWNEIKKAAHIVADVMPQMSYMGIDFCVTNEDKVKIIEINSLSSLDSIQTDQSIFNTPGGDFFKERLYKK